MPGRVFGTDKLRWQGGEKLNLVGVAEVADLLGISRQRVNVLLRTARDFPVPVAELKACRIWRREDVVRWALQTGRLRRSQALPVARADRRSARRRS
jgi:hypothetical protein